MKKGLFSFRKDHASTKFLPFSYHLTDNIVSLKGYEYTTLIQVGGKSYQTKDASEIYRWIENLNTMSRTVANEHVEFYSYIIRRDMMKYPDGEYDNYFAKNLNAKYQKEFEDTDTNPLKVNELYLAIVYKPFGNSVLSGIKKKIFTSYDAVKMFQNDCIKELETITEKMLTALGDYDPRLLGTYSQKLPGIDREIVFSEPMEVMSFILNGRKERVPLTSKRFAASLPSTQIKFSKHGEFGIRRYNGEAEIVGMLDIADYEKHTFPGQLDYLLESDFSFVIANSFGYISDRAAEGFLKNHIKFMKEQGDVGVTQIRKLDEALDALKSGNFNMGMHHCSVMVSAPEIKEVRKRLVSVTNDLSSHGLIMKQCTKSLEATFWAQFPGNRKYRARAKPVTSYNFWCFSSFHNFLTGKAQGNPWGDAITAFKTDSRTPFFFSWHDSPLNQNSQGKRPVGHTGIFGKTGAGKTALLDFLLTMSTKAKLNAVIFDKDRGMENTVRANGGVYNAVEWGVPTGWNPLQLEPTLKNISFLKEFIAELALGGTSRELSDEDKRDISTAVDSVMTKADKSERNLTTLSYMLPPGDENRVSVSKLLFPWVDGDYKWVFNNKTDNLELGKGYYGFDTTQFLEKKAIRVPILRYLTHRGDEMINGEPFAYVFEECWNFCSDEFFIKLIKDKLKTIRKNNGIVIFSTQEPNDVLSSPIGRTFAASLATVIALRNDKANEEDYRVLGLSDVEIDIIKTMAETDRRFIIKQNRISAVARFDMSRYSDEMEILSGSEDTAIILNQCINDVGNEVEKWLPVYYERIRKQKK